MSAVAPRPAPLPSRATARATAGAEPRVDRGTYSGQAIGVEYGMHPEMSTLELPDRMSRVWSLHHADGWRLVVASRGPDLVVLLTDEDGVVTDDVSILDAADRFSVVHDCGDDVTPSFILTSACAQGSTSTPSIRSWSPAGGALVEATTAAECRCDAW